MLPQNDPTVRLIAKPIDWEKLRERLALYGGKWEPAAQHHLVFG